MGTVVMDVVKIKRHLEIAVRWSGEEIQAPVLGEKIVSQFNDRRNRSIDKHASKPTLSVNARNVAAGFSSTEVLT